MPTAFDSVLTSSDLSLDRVLQAGLPVALVFYDKDLPGDLRQAMDHLARQYAGKVLLVMLARSDAQQALSRFDVHQLPTLLTWQDGRLVSRQAGVTSSELKAHVAHLAGEAPLPSPRTAAQSAEAKKETAQGPLSVNEANFDREVLQSNRPVMVDFWAPWCAPCHMVAPTIEKLAREYGNALKVVKVNVDENPGLATRYRAMSIPTMLIIKAGREVDRWVGAQPENVIRGRVARWIQGAPQAA